MGTIQIKKVEKTVTTGKMGQERQKVKKTGDNGGGFDSGS